MAARGDYLCAAITRPGHIAGVTHEGVNWFRKEGEGFVLQARTKLNAPDAVACFVAQDSGELLVLGATGRVQLLSIPG